MIIICPQCQARNTLDDEMFSQITEAMPCENCGGKLPVRLGEIHRKSKMSSGDLEVPAGKSAKKRVLIADDTYYFREVISDKLKALDIEVLCAEDGEETLQVVKREMPNLDLLILDLKMPKIHGAKVLNEIRAGAMGKNLKILCTSAVHNKADEVRALRELGADGFITKEAALEDFITRVKKLLGLEVE